MTTLLKERLPLTIDLLPVRPSSPGKGSRGWRSQALCADKTHLFFEQPGEREGRRARREAKARSYCDLCPVTEQCREAGRLGREHGMWGGETDEQRALAGYAPRSISRRAIAAAARKGRLDSRSSAAEAVESRALTREAHAASGIR